jgi:hypothetical protein
MNKGDVYMNKLVSKFCIVLICLSIGLSGCAASSQPSEVELNNKVNQVGEEKDANKEEKRSRKRPDIFGRVKSITGNELVLEIAKMPQMSANRDNKQKNKGVGVPIGEEKGSGKRFQGSGGRELEFTGETVTLLIPVGIPITTRSQSGTRAIDLVDIYEGSSLQIWFDDIDKEERMITHVVMLQGR